MPTGNPPYANTDGGPNYAPGGEIPPPHICAACGDLHPLGWCRLKLAGVEHCGLCGIAHLGYGRACPHLNSERQVATLLGTLKESTEPRELIDKATKYLRMIRGDLVQRKRYQERKSQKQADPEPMGYQPRVDPVRLDSHPNVAPVRVPAVNGGGGPAEEWQNASSGSRSQGLYPPAPPDERSRR